MTAAFWKISWPVMLGSWQSRDGAPAAAKVAGRQAGRRADGQEGDRLWMTYAGLEEAKVPHQAPNRRRRVILGCKTLWIIFNPRLRKQSRFM